jgi:hypothetical protein
MGRGEDLPNGEFRGRICCVCAFLCDCAAIAHPCVFKADSTRDWQACLDGDAAVASRSKQAFALSSRV